MCVCLVVGLIEVCVCVCVCVCVWNGHLKAGSQYNAEPCVALCNYEHCAMVKIAQWLKRVKTHRNTEEHKNRPGFYSSIVMHCNAMPWVYCEPALTLPLNIGSDEVLYAHKNLQEMLMKKSSTAPD